MDVKELLKKEFLKKYGILNSFVDDTILINYIRNSDDKEIILEKYLQELEEHYPKLLFKIIYDDPHYNNILMRILNDNIEYLSDDRLLFCFINEVSWALDFISNNIDEIMGFNSDFVYLLTKSYLFNTNMKAKKIILKLAYCDNLHVRASFMKTIFEEYRSKIEYFYGKNITEYFVKKDENGNILEIMDERDLCEIAGNLFDYVFLEEFYRQIFNFIMDNFKENHLASEIDLHDRLDPLENDIFHRHEMLIKDIDKLFITSVDYKLTLYFKYKKFLSAKIVEEFEKVLRIFPNVDYAILEDIFNAGLGNLFFLYVDRYLEKSVGCKVVKRLKPGSCADIWQIGNYLIKFSNKKWENSRCPDNYLIIKNYEEDYVRDENGNIIGCLEVQKYLSKHVLATDTDLVEKFLSALSDLGYCYKDSLLNGPTGPNALLLDDYHDADVEDPESLPEWFKEKPLVLVDRDLVLKLSN